MKQTLVLIITIFLGIEVFAQISAQSFDNLPENNLMVEKSLEILTIIREGKIEKINDTYKIEQISNDSFDKLKYYVENGVLEDTIMIEFYEVDPRTEISFRLNCNDLKEGLTYWIKINAEGVKGSTKNLTVLIEQDYSYLKTENELENLLKELD